MRRAVALCLTALVTACSDETSPADGDAGADVTDVAPDVAAPDADEPDVAAPDVEEPDVAAPDVAAPDVTEPDVASPDVAEPVDVADVTAPDVAAPDVTVMDVAAPDVAVDAPRDVAVPDVAVDAPRDAGDASDAGVVPWVGIVGTGQSLSVGAAAGRTLNTAQPYNNLKLRDMGSAPLYDGMGDRLSVVPLVEPIRAGLSGAGYPGAPLYPTNILGETPHTAMANQVTSLSRAMLGRDYVSVHSVVGESGRSITSIGYMGTGRAYAATLYEARALRDLARAAGRPFTYGAIVLTHGESDGSRATYGDDVYRTWRQYNVDLRGITGQATPIPMLLSQQCTVPNTAGSRSLSTQAQWRLGVDHPGEVICVGPKYQYQYAADRLHLDAYGYQRLGYKYAQVYYEAVVRGRAWRPLEPTGVRRAGAVITVTFHVPVAPLAWDANIPAPHQSAYTEWARGRGFEVESSAGRQRITEVRIVGNTVEIQLAAAPTGNNLVVRYAMTQDTGGYQGGPTTGRRGQLVDSDPFVPLDRASLRVRVTRGSPMVTAVAPATFAARGVRDLVAGPGLGDDTIVTARTDAAVTLSRPWPGATGEAMLTFRSDQRNYCVQFEMRVP